MKMSDALAGVFIVMAAIIISLPIASLLRTVKVPIVP